jgi:amino acid adenylation domain-containing protein
MEPGVLGFSLAPKLSLGCNVRARELSVDSLSMLQAALEALVLRYEGALGEGCDRTLRQIMTVDDARAQDVSGANFAVGFDAAFELGLDSGELGADLVLTVRNLEAECISGEWRYRRDWFDAETVTRIDRDYARLLAALIEAPDSPSSKPALLSGEERETVVHAWNDTRTEYPRSASIPELFERVAREHASQIAVVEGTERLTYAELNTRADAMAAYLAARGVETGSRVGLALERSSAMIVSMLAVLKCGAAYVPLDAGYPAERLRFMIADTAPCVILVDRKNKEKLAGEACVSIEDVPRELRGASVPPGRATAESTAYIMYTSGSTGTPKGVEVLHRGIVRLVRNSGYVDFGPREVFGQISNASFDAITFEVWGALLNGGRLVILPTRVVLSPDAFADAIREHGITAMFLTSSLFNFVAARRPDAFRGMRHLLVGGDAVDPRWARHILEMGAPERLINGYGPTECTTFSVTHDIREVPQGAATVPIGRPIGNSQAYVLDRHMRPVPAGVPGELYLGGDGLAKGYWNRPELTRERFVPSPFDPAGHARLYKTGDLARYRKDGVIECLGRLDRQIKMRGFRIELGEIETVLRTHPLVHDCVVSLNGGAAASPSLLAHVATDADSGLATADVRQYLKQRLPEFMLPSAVMFLDELPLSANGKVDRSKLPHFEGPVLADQKSAIPLTEAQQMIALAWMNALGIQRVGLDDNFFDIGGDSLRMAAVECELKANFQRAFTIVDLFEHPTVRSLTAWLTDSQISGNRASDAQERARRQQAALSGMRVVRRGA